MFNKVYNKLIQYSWFRKMYDSTDTYVKADNVWRNLKDFKKGEKITIVDGKWNTQAFCTCGNELIHSNSNIGKRFIKETDQWVFDYECSFCGRKSHWNPDVIPGLFPCDENGNLKKEELL